MEQYLFENNNKKITTDALASRDREQNNDALGIGPGHWYISQRKRLPEFGLGYYLSPQHNV